MKLRLIILFIWASLTSNAQSTAWTTELITFGAGQQANLGTASNHCLNFFTAGSKRLELTPSGTMKVLNLAGDGSRLVLADATGVLSTAPLTFGSGVLNVTGRVS